jgi:protein-disulfide isomerase
LAPTRWIALVPPLALVTLTAATCNKAGPGGAETVDSGASAAPPADPPSDGKLNPVLAGIPGLDFSILPPPAQKELAAVMTDEFCYCGCPHTLGACLKTHPACKHAKRMVRLAAGDAAAGLTSNEIIVGLQKYYLSFKDRANLKADPRMCTGSPDAKVTLVEFSDFECPFCGAARPLLEQFVKDSAGKVRLCYAPFPLKAHANAIPAGQAALFARDQGKFWEMHDLLFENQTTLSVDAIKGLAAKMGLNAAELAKVLAGSKYQDELNASKEAGTTAGVNATPTVYVNGRKLELPLSPELLQQTVEDEQEWSANNGWAAD